ncbi:MAG: hypothetical protein WCY19_01260 [Candidatus Gastranaerophilaceae bacterium]
MKPDRPHEIIKVLGKTFVFANDLNPITKEWDLHIYLRHLVLAEEAIAAFFNITEQIYNIKYDRYEAYSQEDNMYVYYFYYKNNKNIIMIITAFKKD